MEVLSFFLSSQEGIVGLTKAGHISYFIVCIVTHLIYENMYYSIQEKGVY